MPWIETKPGLWQRPIGDNEKSIKFIGDRSHQIGREHWSVTSGARFTLNRGQTLAELSNQCLNAWCAFRFDHPSIACTVDGDTLSYHTPSNEGLASWANETFHVHDLDSTADDLIATLKPSRFITAHLLPGESKVILHAAHWRTDGYGALQLLHAFLGSLCKAVSGDTRTIAWGEEWCRLTPSIEEVLGLPVTATPEVLEATQECMKTLAYTRGAVGVAVTAAQNTAPGGTASAHFSLTEADTSAVMAACAERDISLLSAVHASCAALTRQEASSDARDKHYTSTMRFSLRPHLPPPYSGPAFAAGLYTAGYMFPVPVSQSWIENAKQYERQYNTGITEDFLKCRRQYAVEILGILQRGAPPPDPPPSEVDISSFTHNGTVLEVQDVSIGVETLTRQTYCFLWTFRGRLELHLVYNKAYYEPDRAERMVRTLAKTLQTELGLA
ncbi:uncharacterized protein BDV17DRAFT_299631 [Aspergillus undulatus]|uniref:uncharacterized protein n=1 Tax=Aspergillus undulatus TaxID=1810928 RepID=UPI003CCDE138